MKILTFLLLLLYYPVFAQQTDNEENVIIRINGVDYDSGKIYFNPKNVKDFRKEKTAEDSIYSSHRYKSIHVKRKKKIAMAPIKEMEVNLRKNNNIPDNEKIQVVIDGVILPTTEDCFIEQDYIKEVHIKISDPKTRGDHRYHSPTIILTTKKSVK